MSDYTYSKRIEGVQDSIIPLINKLAREHPGTISLGQGVVYYDPPPSAFDEIKKQLANKSLNGYGPVEGIPILTDTIAKKLAAKNNIQINDKNKIFVTAGSNMAFSSLIPVITDPGDEIILLTPYYFNHDMAVKIADAIPILVPTLYNFHPDIEKIKDVITSKTRAIVTISPNNPTGVVYTRDELTQINQLCAEKGIYHISDEAYEDFVFEGEPHFSVASLTNTEEHTICLYSLSKSYGFAGWRVGYMVLPDKLFSSFKKVQDTILISPPIVSQYAAIGAYASPPSYIEERIKIIKQSRQVCLDALNQSNVLDRPAISEGALYIFAKLKSNQDDLTLASNLVKQHGIATIPGSAFATNDGAYLRISYGALTSDTVKKGIDNLIIGLSHQIK
ncbi:MAG: pyridoxal phosphate-dependent aminotransferase [Pseudomonadota bacterium]